MNHLASIRIRAMCTEQTRCRPAPGEARLDVVASIKWGQNLAEACDAVYAAQREPQVMDPVLGALTALGGTGPLLESAVGTGRVALPLASRGLDVHGIELSSHMAEPCRPERG